MGDARRILNLTLIGFMGSGKSSTGQILAGQLNFHFLDTDAMIEERAGKPITDIFADDGEAAFRAWESQVVGELETSTESVISTGGGLAANDSNLASLKTHSLVVCLWAGAEAIWQRVRRQSHRPLLAGPAPRENIAKLLKEREPFYRKADVLINTEMRSLRDVAQQAHYHFQQARDGT